ncbi:MULTISPECIES: HAD family hydrolase [Methanobrevibacter]|jgi:phosphoglycolate phosphatase|uniref:HAD family hydrolase n=1 Tax=Methanobrevibacter TaxID=2172 RepID=UPI0003348359|nr:MULTISPECIES: HAD family hydrolase [Methanobrevibacter]AGN16927.1 hydrolase HAD superfamily [Methanobrevibacter sp. AbM4]MCI6775119.1 HAD family hydrolase [Methanobrevibacter boviskoreani]MDD6255958.1 HAD family hydrolase [Methanobrevibacter boviskoreani]MDY5614760.1 HAD family hydrolase [Methanobrevibacter boviskoreani]
MKKLYIFDFDGTLVDTLYDSVSAYNKALEKFNQPIFPFKTADDINFEEFISFMGSDEDILEEYMDIYIRSPKDHTKPYDGILETLAELNSNPDITLAVCSNRMDDLLRMLVLKLFPNIDFKYVIGHIRDEPFKPDPFLINKIIKSEDFLKEEIVYIGDRYTDIQTGKNVDVDVIVVKWGQGSDDAYLDDYPIKVVDKPSEILDL